MRATLRSCVLGSRPRVDYFEAEKRAMIELLASLRGEVPTQLPVRLLHLPGDDPDDPCAGVTSP